MDIENFIAEFKKTFVYDLLSMTLKDEQLFEHMVDGDAVLWFKEQTRQMWLMWEKAKAQAVPEYAEFYLGGGVFAICDWKDYETVKNFKWNTSSRQSRTQWVWAHDPKNADINRRKVAMHNLIMCPPEGLYVDHINGNGLDNRRSNLRIVTKQQNTFNSAHKGGTSKYKGVCLEKESGMWKAYITKDGKKKSIGRFALEDDAARAYDKEAISLFREHAKLNFLPKAMIEAQEPAND